MRFQEYDLGLRRSGEIVEVTLRGTEANVQLMDASNLSAFKAGGRHTFFGGHVRRSPVRLQVPSAGHWYVVVHLGGASGRVSSSVVVLPGSIG